MARTKSSNAWLAEHFSDPYVKRAQKEGYRSRAVYKLKELDERDHLLRPGMTIIDLGAAPGGWSQYARQRVGEKGRVIALDILPMDPIEGVTCLTADFTEDSALKLLEESLAGHPAHLVISDMAPNIRGIASVDVARAAHLVELAVEFARLQLGHGGGFVTKVFHGSEFTQIIKHLRGLFESVSIRKPPASRARSAEVYIVAKGFRGS
jgi:23S rRNA (uridine2552-2'-O)-methyltransferase